MKAFLLGELRFYTRLVIIAVMTVFLVTHWVIPSTLAWADAQRQAAVHSVTQAPKTWIDDLKEKWSSSTPARP